jgi:hypothetical protein
MGDRCGEEFVVSPVLSLIAARMPALPASQPRDFTEAMLPTRPPSR